MGVELAPWMPVDARTTIPTVAKSISAPGTSACTGKRASSRELRPRGPKPGYEALWL